MARHEGEGVVGGYQGWRGGGGGCEGQVQEGEERLGKDVHCRCVCVGVDVILIICRRWDSRMRGCRLRELGVLSILSSLGWSNARL